MKTKSDRAFWDSSALVSLFCRDSYSSRSRNLLRNFPKIITWWGTPVEIHSTFLRLQRSGDLTTESLQKSLNQLNNMRLRWKEILPIDKVRDLAEVCLDQYGIRSGDAMQLAAALVWCDEKPRTYNFICFDTGLLKAAQSAGFQIHSE